MRKQRIKHHGGRSREEGAADLGEGQRQRGQQLVLGSSPVLGSILFPILAAPMDTMKYACDLVINDPLGLNQLE